jgi:hypothetical protein
MEKLTLRQQDRGRVLVASNLVARQNFINAVYQCARGDEPISFALRDGSFGSHVCAYKTGLAEVKCRQHALAVAKSLELDLTDLL